MHRVRIVIHHDPQDAAEDLRCAARLRHDLWSHSAAEIDPGSPQHGTHRDSFGNAYFEFATDELQEVKRVISEFGYSDRTRVEVVQEGNGTECVNCGNISPEPVTVCPNCHYRDIDPCPYCQNETARLDYVALGGDVFVCPNCSRRVRFQFHDPLFNAQGHYNEPLVCVTPAEAPVNNDV